MGTKDLARYGFNFDSRISGGMMYQNPHQLTNSRALKFGAASRYSPSRRRAATPSSSTDSWTSEIQAFEQATSIHSSLSSNSGGGHSENFNAYSLTLKILYPTSYGQNIGVCGNLNILGNWRTNRAFHLRWTDGHIWTGTFVIPLDSYQRSGSG